MIVIVTPIPMGISWNPWDPNCSHSHAYHSAVASEISPGVSTCHKNTHCTKVCCNSRFGEKAGECSLHTRV